MDIDRPALLVVDDSEIDRTLLSRALSEKGYEIAVVQDGQEAIGAVTANRFDLVLLDIEMPGIDGFGVLEILRKSHTITDLPVIMATSRDQSADIVRALNLGANDYVTKPFDLAVVLARVQTQLRLKRLSDLKDQFLRIASHDLKNPLSMVLAGSSAVVALVPPGATMTEKAHKMFAHIEKSAEAMKRIIEDFLDFQAMEDGQIQLSLQAADLNDLVSQVVEQNAEYAREKRIEVTFHPAPGPPSVNADVARISQVAQNLIGNAIKFSPPNQPVKVSTRENEKDVWVEVCDSGPGLTDEDMKKLFARYSRLSNKPTGGEKSSGLGLYICKQLIHLHGGEIGARGNPDRGATFWFRLPKKRTVEEMPKG